jgi:hypothetical protein
VLCLNAFSISAFERLPSSGFGSSSSSDVMLPLFRDASGNDRRLPKVYFARRSRRRLDDRQRRAGFCCAVPLPFGTAHSGNDGDAREDAKNRNA